MIEKVKIFNRLNMEMFALNEGLNFPYKGRNWSLVSIHTTPEELFLKERTIKELKKLGMKDYISLCFWDITPEDKERVSADYPDAIFFNEAQAKEVIEIIDKTNKLDNAVLVAHCDAGISRSGAVGTFTVEYLDLDHEGFINENPYLHPNQFVIRTLREVSGYEYKSAFGEIK